MSVAAALWISLALLLGNSYFVAAEFAVMAARRSTLEPLADAGSARASACLRAIEQMGSMLAAAQLGITVCSVGLGALAEAALHETLLPLTEGLPLGPVWADGLALAGALLVVVYLHVVVGEMIPKNLTLAGPDRAALLLVPSLLSFSRALGPVQRVLSALARGLLWWLFRVRATEEIASVFTADEVGHILAESRAEGLIEEDREGLARSVLEFSDRLAGDVAVPQDRLVSVAKGVTPAEIEALVARTGFSRYPYRDKQGLIVGYVHLKDVLHADPERREKAVPRKRVRRLPTVQGGEEVEDALAAMQRDGAHLARVVDDAGQETGVVFFEDVIELLVGPSEGPPAGMPAC